MTEATETIELDDLGPEAPEVPTPNYHTLLKVWQSVLAPARGAMGQEKVTPQWATRIVSTYPQVSFSDTPGVNALFFLIVNELSTILDQIVESDDQCLSWQTAEDDVANNSQHYKDVLTEWQKHMLRRELEWDADDPDAAVMLAAMSEVHNMFFGEKGLVGHLDQIKFEFTEADQAELQQALEDTRAAYFGEVTDE